MPQMQLYNVILK